jgi:hypothetical protein
MSCPHELRPGITTCLHCKHDARRAAGDRRTRTLKGVAGAVIAVAAVAGLGVAGMRFLKERAPRSTATQDPLISTPVVVAPTPSHDSVVPANVPSAEAATPPQTPSQLALSPVIPEGVTEHASGVRSTRTGDTVVVNFDTPMMRTRRPEKFEEIVRSTLVEVYGTPADSLLSGIPRGSLVQVQDLFADLPTRGLHINLPAGGALALWPQTRMREDGPLVIAYLATVTR